MGVGWVGDSLGSSSAESAVRMDDADIKNFNEWLSFVPVFRRGDAAAFVYRLLVDGFSEEF